MKRVLSSLVILSALLLSLPAEAQLAFGVKGGVNVTSLSFDEDVFNASNRLGFFIGPTARLDLPVLGFDIAALYEQKDAKVNDETITMKSIVVPLNLRLRLSMLYLSVGPQVGFNVGTDEFNWRDKETYDSTFRMKGTNLSANIGGGIRLSHFEVGINYNMPLGKTADATWRSIYEDAIKTYDDAKAKTWTLSAAYYF